MTKRLLLSLVLALGVSAASRAGTEVSTNTVVAAGQFVRLLANREFAAAVARFDATMKQALPEPKLRETWEGLLEQVGPFKQELRLHTLQYGGYDIVLVSCKFERAVLDAKVVFNAAGQISGLFFVPAQAPAETETPPPYVRANAFREQEFTVGNRPWRLPGTLTLPVAAEAAGTPCPAVVLVHGSGPNDRDETVGANKPFRDLAWGLASQGIAVLRYEKRTKEYAAKLMLNGLAHFTVKEETLDDALTAVAQLRQTAGINPKRVFVLGHSLGGIVAPRLGQSDPHLAGLIILAGATRPLEDLMLEQTRYLFSLKGSGAAAAKTNLNQVIADVERIKKLTPADAASPTTILGAPPAYWLDLHAHDPLAAAKELKQPMLILQGGRDYQVTEVDFKRWKATLGSRPNVTLKLYPELNHLFMAGKGKSTPAEYEQPGHVADAVVMEIANWIRALK